MSFWPRTAPRARPKSARRSRGTCACVPATSTSSAPSSAQPRMTAAKWVGAAVLRKEDEPLPAVVDADAAITPEAPVLFDELGSNVLWHDTLVYGDVEGAFASADGVLHERFEMQRYASTPLETFGCIAEYDAPDTYSFWT